MEQKSQRKGIRNLFGSKRPKESRARCGRLDYSTLEVRRVLTTFYYVNDGVYDPAVDLYSTTFGSASNTGLDPSSPRDSIRSILEDYTVGPDSVILVDDGVYAINQTILVGTRKGDDSGDASNPLTIQGPTTGDGQAVLERDDDIFGDNIFEITDGENISIHHFTK